MDLEKWYRRTGFVLGVLVAASFFAAIYFWIFGFRYYVLNTVFHVCWLTFFSWVVVSPTMIRDWRKRLGVKYGVGALLFLVPAFLIGDNFVRLFTPSIVLLSSDANWSLLPLSGLYVFLALIVGRSAALNADMGPRFRHWSLMVCCTVLSLLLLPEATILRLDDSLHRSWYVSLLKTRGEYRPMYPSVVVVEIEAHRMSHERVLDLIRILAAGHPHVIAVNSDTTPREELDKLKFQGLDVVQSYGPDRQNPESRYGIPTIDGWPGSLDRKLSMYYRPIAPNGIDFGVKTAYAYLKRIERGAGFVATDRSLMIGSRKLPLSSDGRILINYYRNMEWEFEWKFERPVFAYFLYGESGPNEGFLYGLGRVSPDLFYINFEKKRLETQTGEVIEEREPYSGMRKKRALEPAKFLEAQNRILLINIQDQPINLAGLRDLSNGLVYATIIQNILDRDFLKEPAGWVDALMTLLVIGLITLAFVRYNVYRASVGVVIGSVAAAGLLMFVFVYGDTLITIYPVVLPLVATIAFFLPAGISMDRETLFQEQSRLQAELNTAHDMQMGLMPVADPVVKGYDISGLCVPANEVGGDFFDYVWLDRKQTKFGIALADVSGKAMKAAMTAVMTSGMIYRELGSNGTPKTILRRINKPLYAKLDQRMFTAMSLAAIDLRTKEITLSSAGQVHPLMLRDGQVQRLKVKGERLPLGVMEEVRYEELKFKLKKGDTIVFFTDGVVEAMNGQRDLYGTERLEQELLSAGGFTAKALREHIIASVGQFAGKAEQHDDMTVVVVKVL